MLARFLVQVVLAATFFLCCHAQDEQIMKEDWCYEDNCYELLGVNDTADFRVIKSSYNNISLRLHPDKNPNATEEEKQLYVKVNRAYEILSNAKKRSDYDRYLTIRSAWDAPKEHPIVVIILIYLGVTFIVLQYQKQHYRNVRKSILETPIVQRWVEKKFGIDVTGKKKSSKKKEKKAKRGKKSRSDQLQTSASLLTDVDPTANNPMDEVSDAQINQAIRALKLVVPEWNAEKPHPEFKDAMWVVPLWIQRTSKTLFHEIRIQLKQSILQQELSQEDREYLCRKHNKMTEEHWKSLSKAEKQALLKKAGKGKNSSKSPSPERAQGNLRRRGRKGNT